MIEDEEARYNVVILPVRDAAGGKRYMLSAGRPGSPRLISAFWGLAEVRAALTAMGATGWQIEELLRGNRMAISRRDTGYLYFKKKHLEAVGLVPVEEPTGDLVS